MRCKLCLQTKDNLHSPSKGFVFAFPLQGRNAAPRDNPYLFECERLSLEQQQRHNTRQGPMWCDASGLVPSLIQNHIARPCTKSNRFEASVRAFHFEGGTLRLSNHFAGPLRDKNAIRANFGATKKFESI